MGYIRNNRLIILSPQKQVGMYIPDFQSGAGTKAIPDTTLVNEAIAWYQGANFLYKSGNYKIKK
jgi:hypothetical protein